MSTPIMPRRLDGNGTALRIRALIAMGFTVQQVADASGLYRATVQRLATADMTTVTPQIFAAIVGVFDAWWDLVPPETTPRERQAARASRERAREQSWCSGMALDEELTDVPGYRPLARWRRATGTGVADLAAVRRAA
jgi:hypothetical protein